MIGCSMAGTAYLLTAALAKNHVHLLIAFAIAGDYIKVYVLLGHGDSKKLL